jgi:RES domain-containing protein
LQSSRYSANSGKGAAIHGGRWNIKGVEAIYTASSRSLAVLEILVHFAVLPKDFVLTPIRIPRGIRIAKIREELPEGWDEPLPNSAARDLVAKRFHLNEVFAVPSTIVPDETNYVLNPTHSKFKQIKFLAPEPFHFDPRLFDPRLR